MDGYDTPTYGARAVAYRYLRKSWDELTIEEKTLVNDFSRMEVRLRTVDQCLKVMSTE